MSAEIVNFCQAQVGDHAHTWELAYDDFGDYHFETAGDPRELYGEEGPCIRKTWVLVAVDEYPGIDGEMP